jgi:CBS domain-containing protein
VTPPQRPSPAGSVQAYQGSYLTPALEHATVLDAMHPGVLTCAPDASLVDVARMMATHHVHAVAVLGIDAPEHARLVWGIVSDLDVVRAAQTAGTETVTAGKVAATEPVTVDADEPLLTAAQVMQEHDVHHLVVVSGRDPRPIGILSSLDVAGVIAWGRG